MFCTNCGKEIDEKAVVCIHCGVAVKKEQPDSVEHSQSKTGIGVLMGILLGLIGLLIGVLMYPANTIARKTFIKGWGITFAICAVLTIVLYIIFYFILGFAYYMY
ncbi:MAG: zinc ribbon domain-containing protein [Clostridia bacterium]|nr:zinc ribbon domain-containing protein [Clostridia bacterium]